MIYYLIRRLLLFPFTLLTIVMINFGIINLSPGDPSTFSLSQLSGTAEATSIDTQSVLRDFPNLQFRTNYGLTLPIFWNNWPHIDTQTLLEQIQALTNPNIPNHEYSLTVNKLGDQAPYIMHNLLTLIENPQLPFDVRKLAATLFIRGGTRQAYLEPNPSAKRREINQHIAQTNLELQHIDIQTPQELRSSLDAFDTFIKYPWIYPKEPNWPQTLYTFFFDTRFAHFMHRTLTLDFGTLRNDSNRYVIDEVLKRIPISLTLSVFPLFLTLFLCLLFGYAMAYSQNSLLDHSLSFLFLTLFSIPVFVAAPFLLEKLALNHTFPLTNTPIPIQGFHSKPSLFENLTLLGKIQDIAQHIAIPLLAILYGSLATQSRLVRYTILDVIQQDYIRTCYAKGLSKTRTALTHILKHISIIVITSLAGSFTTILGGSLIVETIFEIHGFGKFFYEGILNRDYNVIMFSTLSTSILTLIGYLIADIAYAALDPRVSYE